MYACLCLIFSAVRDDRKIPRKKADAQFDREIQPYFDLRIHCYDGGKTPLSSFAHIRVNVVDENDQAFIKL